MEEKIHEEYFRLTLEYKQKYGEKVALLMQVGAFFEIYGYKVGDNITDKSNIQTIVQICGGLAIADKKVFYMDGQIVMAGFRDYNLDKYIPYFMDNGYTVVVYVQEPSQTKKGMNRVLHTIYSPGTYMVNDLYVDQSISSISNHILCVWIEKYKPLTKPYGSIKEKMVCGMSVVNILTGQSHMFEYETSFVMTPTTFDEMERWFSIYTPSEVLFIGPMDDHVKQSILNYAGCATTTTHLYNTVMPIDVIHNCAKPVYIRHIISTFYGEDAMDVCSEFTSWPIATQSFCYLMHFIQEHNPNLVKQIAKPLFHNTSSRMILANHTLKQLNIVKDGNHPNVSHASISSFLNRCCTSPGKRLFYSQITNPVCNVSWISKEYNVQSYLCLNPSFIETSRNHLRPLIDLEKISRQILIKKITPSSLYRLNHSVLEIQKLHDTLLQHNVICDYLFEKDSRDEYKHMHCAMEIILNTLHDTLILDECASLNHYKFEHNIIRPNKSIELDKWMKKYHECETSFLNVKQILNGFLSSNQEVEYIRIHETDKHGKSLQITKARGKILRKLLSKENTVLFCISGVIREINANDIKFKSNGGLHETIDFSELTSVLNELSSAQTHIHDLNISLYTNFVDSLSSNMVSQIEYISVCLAKLDVILSKSFVAMKYNYCCPSISTHTSKSFFNAKQMRHCLIEHIQTNEKYVANDISMGCFEDSPKGILLYGTNAVGKTSLIRAIGICIVMAQAGMYVPCDAFVYYPYTSIYTRILGNDNLFKSLSTFAVEMSELRVILNHADEYSLVLGDELCSGTETESALSIFMAGLIHLEKLGSTFMFATHFHEIVRFNELKQLTSVVLKHLTVYYDRHLDCLVYDRILKDGSGDKMYGLEVAKSLHLPKDFIELAYSIRSTYFSVGGSLGDRQTKYNSNKLIGTCELCKETLATETHHIHEQSESNVGGYINGMYKHHPANLVGLCNRCHKLQHNGSDEKITIKRKTTTGYKRLNQVNSS